MSDKEEPRHNPLVYVPDGAKINIKDDNLPPPTVEYERRRVVLDRDEVRKQITKKDTP